MRLRFQADNDLDQRIVTATRRLDSLIDFQTAPALGLHELDDPEVLALAAREARVLVSHDRRTKPGHFRTFTLTQESPGLIIVTPPAHWQSRRVAALASGGERSRGV